MGGDLTQTVQQKGSAAPVTVQGGDPAAPVTVQGGTTPALFVGSVIPGVPTGPPADLIPLEIHKSGAEIHFHDRASGKKCAVPAAEYYVMKRNMLKLLPDRCVDPINKTILLMTPYYDGTKVDSYLELLPTEIGDTFAALARYTNGGK